MSFFVQVLSHTCNGMSVLSFITIPQGKELLEKLEFYNKGEFDLQKGEYNMQKGLIYNAER